MPLILQAVSLNEQPLSQPIAARFDANGGTIGRADHNSMALPDPERHISRVQAEVVAQGGGSSFIIRNLGAANPVFVGSRSLGEGESAPLTPAEPVRIGGYLLRVSFADSESDDRTRAQRAAGSTVVPAGRTAPPAHRPAAAAPSSPPVAPPPVRPPPAAAPRAAPASSDPFADLLGPASSSPPSSDPFAGLLAPAPMSAPPPPLPPPPPPPAPMAARPLPPAPPPVAARPAPAAADPFADLLGAPSAGPASDPFADLMPSGPAGVAAGSGAFAAPAAPMANARLPDDFDPFAAPAPKAPAAPASTDPFADLMPRQSASIDDFMSGGGGGGGLGGFGGSAGGAGSADPLAAFMADAQKPPGGGLPDDPLAMFGAPPAAPQPAAPQRDDLHSLYGAFQPPQVASASPAPLPPAPAAPISVPRPQPGGKPRPAPVALPPRAAPAAPLPAMAASAGDAALWAALCQGAGLRLPMPADAADRMLALGQILRAAVEGTVQLIALRASTRTELHAAVTMIQSRSNNPLKFSPDVQSALEQIVQPAARGFLDGPAAMQDAMTDLVGHAIGTVAGMRAAFEGMLDRFDPTALEARLTGKSPLDSLVPAMRRARLWDLYLEHYKSLREEAQEDFHALFGRAFLAAYEEQVARLKQGGAD